MILQWKGNSIFYNESADADNGICREWLKETLQIVEGKLVRGTYNLNEIGCSNEWLKSDQHIW